MSNENLIARADAFAAKVEAGDARATDSVVAMLCRRGRRADAIAVVMRARSLRFAQAVAAVREIEAAQ